MTQDKDKLIILSRTYNTDYNLDKITAKELLDSLPIGTARKVLNEFDDSITERGMGSERWSEYFEVKISEYGQGTIPKSIHTALELVPGDKVEMEITIPDTNETAFVTDELGSHGNGPRISINKDKRDAHGIVTPNRFEVRLRKL